MEAIFLMGILDNLLSSISKKGRKPQMMPIRNTVICGKYAVSGINPSTGRKKTVLVIAVAGSEPEAIQQKSGLQPPYEICQKPMALPPTDSQVSYAEKLGFTFPEDATCCDATILLSRAESDQPIVQPCAPAEMVRYVIEKGIEVPSYAGAEEVAALYLHGCGDTERAAFFCMRVFCNLTGESYGYLENATSWEQDVFADFAALYDSDKEFLRSLNYYGADDIPLGTCPKALKRIKAFDIAAVYLKMKGAVK